MWIQGAYSAILTGLEEFVIMADWSAKKDDVVQQLRFLNVNELTEFCTSSNVTIPTAKAGNRDAIHTLVMRFTNSEAVEDSADQMLL